MSDPNPNFSQNYHPFTFVNPCQPFLFNTGHYFVPIYPNFQNQEFGHSLPPLQTAIIPSSICQQPPLSNNQHERNDQDSLPPHQKSNHNLLQMERQSRVPKPERDRRMLRQCLEPAKHDRNIQSNALKLMLKYLRTEIKTENCMVGRLIKKLKIKYSAEQFLTDLNSAISPKLNYVRPCLIEEICKGNNESTFSLLFRICLKEFFTKEIHTISTKPVRTNRFVRREQIRAGRRLLDLLFLDECD